MECQYCASQSAFNSKNGLPHRRMRPKIYKLLGTMAHWGIGEELSESFQANRAMEMFSRDTGPRLGHIVSYYVNDEVWPPCWVFQRRSSMAEIQMRWGSSSLKIMIGPWTCVVAARFTECAAKRVRCVALGNFRTKSEWLHFIDWLCTTALFNWNASLRKWWWC